MNLCPGSIFASLLAERSYASDPILSEATLTTRGCKFSDFRSFVSNFNGGGCGMGEVARVLTIISFRYLGCLIICYYHGTWRLMRYSLSAFLLCILHSAALYCGASSDNGIGGAGVTVTQSGQ